MTTHSNPTIIPPALNLENIPSIYATHPSAKVSHRYGFIPTSVIVHALERSGFFRAPTQFAYYRSPAMTKLLALAATPLDHHVNRGDCDGPIWYGGR